jgi:hypothetical protein
MEEQVHVVLVQPVIRDLRGQLVTTEELARLALRDQPETLVHKELQEIPDLRGQPEILVEQVILVP